MKAPDWLSDLGAGFATFGTGMRLVAAQPRLMRTGLLPALLSTLILLGGLVGVGYGVSPLVTWLTPFADTWVAWSRQMLRGVLSAVVMVGAVVLVVLTFTSVTLAIGAPFYERISVFVDAGRGRTFPDDHRGPLALVRAAFVDGVANLAHSLVVLVPVAIAGVVPILGQIASPIASVLVGSWLACLSLCQPACERRGLLRLRDRRTLLGRRRARVIGFGLPAYLLCLIPFVGVLVYPGAIAGGTILVDDIERELRGWPRATGTLTA